MQHCKALNQVCFKRPTLLDDPINSIPFYCISFSLMIIKNWLINGYWIVEPRHIQPVSCYDNDTNVSFLQSIIQRTFWRLAIFFFLFFFKLTRNEVNDSNSFVLKKRETERKWEGKKAKGNKSLNLFAWFRPHFTT